MTSAEVGDRILRALAEPILMLGRADERTYWPYLGAASALGLVVLLVESSRKGAGAAPRSLRQRLDWDRDALTSVLFEIRYLVARALLSATLFFGINISAARAGLFAQKSVPSLGLAPSLLPSWLVLTIVTVGAFLIEDFVRYWTHRAFHRSAILWQLHQVHHAAERLSPLTIYRTHPLEGLLMQGTSALALGLSAGALSGMFAGKLQFWELSGVHALSFLWNLAGANLRHSSVWWNYPAWLERWLMSPAGHQLHHSAQPEHFDRNFAAVFSLWDRAFGSFVSTRNLERPRFGIEPSERNHDLNVASALLAPVFAALRLAYRSLTGAQSQGVNAAAQKPMTTTQSIAISDSSTGEQS